MNDIAETRRELQSWAARQSEAVRKIANLIIVGLGQPQRVTMNRFLMRDVERLREAVAESRR